MIELLFSKKLRINAKTINTRLDELRLIPNKTIEEQKEFINLAYPKTGKFKFSFRWLLNILIYIFQFVVLMYFINMGINYTGWEVTLLQAILIIMICPLIIAFVLKRLGVNKHEPLLHITKGFIGLLKMAFKKQK
jgi:hypothetical protein